jgi:hypothetical protein
MHCCAAVTIDTLRRVNACARSSNVELVANVYGIGGFPSGGVPLLAVPLFVGAPKTVTTSGGGVNVTTISARTPEKTRSTSAWEST